MEVRKNTSSNNSRSKLWHTRKNLSKTLIINQVKNRNSLDTHNNNLVKNHSLSGHKNNPSVK